MATGKDICYLTSRQVLRFYISHSFIPNRGAVDLTTTFNLLAEGGAKTPASPASPGSAKRKIHRGPECDAQKGKPTSLMAVL